MSTTQVLPVTTSFLIDLVELPIGFIMDDFPYFEFNFFPPMTGNAEPDKVERIWRAEFDYMREHAPEGVLIISMHPQCIGRGSRMAMLERFLTHVKDSGGQFVTARAAAATWFAANTPTTPQQLEQSGQPQP
jgi:peptidoglycan-N-acetylglucosamine deacetylase